LSRRTASLHHIVFAARSSPFCGAQAVACGLPVASAGAEEAANPTLKAPVVPVPPLFTEEAIETAVAGLDRIVESAMTTTSLPGVAVGVVYKDRTIYAKGFGVRQVGKPGAIDPDTVFQLASVSKPITSTIVAKLVGDGVVKWEDPAKHAQSRLRAS
jgi:CubicO group peptidase (beta-lactamase class C family)